MFNMSNDSCLIDNEARQKSASIRQTVFARLLPSSLQLRKGKFDKAEKVTYNQVRPCSTSATSRILVQLHRPLPG
jgi:hypothetical protein